MSKYKGKKILIVGFGRSGVAVAQYMNKHGAKITVTDIKQKEELRDSIEAVGDIEIEWELGKHNDASFKSADLIVVSPGVPLSLRVIEEARKAGVPVTNELDLAASLLSEPVIAITGTNGKTTTTSLLGDIFKADGRRTFVGGNIGTPLLTHITDGSPGDAVIAEVSSFQLELIEKLSPAVAVFTNLEEDHLDRYPDMIGYLAAKKRLLKACDRNSFIVLNYDNPNVAVFADEAPGKVLWFTRRNPMLIGGTFAEKFSGAYYDASARKIVSKFNGKEESYDLSGFRLLGDHNKENLLAAICAAKAQGITQAAIQKVINEFKGVPHRLEFIRRKDGVYFFNDSKGTNVMSVMKSLASFQHSPVILIAGGKDKNQDFTPLVDLVQKKVKILILLGEAKEKMNRAIGDFAETFLVGTYEEAVLLAFQKSRSGDVVLLSPGCSSYDMFRNFEERGDYFKKLVNQL